MSHSQFNQNDTHASPAKLGRSCLGCSTNANQGDASLAMKDLIKPARTFALSAASFIFSAIAAVLVITALAACAGDRKSTRLNSSHVSISYAVFCLKKKI